MARLSAALAVVVLLAGELSTPSHPARPRMYMGGERCVEIHPAVHRHGWPPGASLAARPPAGGAGAATRNPAGGTGRIVGVGPANGYDCTWRRPRAPGRRDVTRPRPLPARRPAAFAMCAARPAPVHLEAGHSRK
jgi:hypothetical protein